MNYEEFRRHLGKAGLTVNEFSSLISVRASSVSNYAKKGTVPLRYAVIAVLLGDAADRHVDFRDLLARFGLPTRGAQRVNGKVAHLNEFRKRPSGTSQ